MNLSILLPSNTIFAIAWEDKDIAREDKDIAREGNTIPFPHNGIITFVTIHSQLT